MPRTVSIASNVGPAVTITLRPGELLGREEREARLAASSSGSSMRPMPTSPHAWSPARGPEDRDAVGAKRGDVALRGGVVPHLDGSSRAPPAAGSCARGTRWRAGRRQMPCASLAMKSALRGRDDDRVHAARELDVRHVVGEARVPEVGHHGLAGERLERRGRRRISWPASVIATLHLARYSSAGAARARPTFVGGDAAGDARAADGESRPCP